MSTVRLLAAIALFASLGWAAVMWRRLQYAHAAGKRANDLIRRLSIAIRQEVLTLQGYKVATAATAEEAEGILHRQVSRVIGLVIADVHLTADPRGQEGYALYQC